jgi:hypothetical protein
MKEPMSRLQQKKLRGRTCAWCGAQIEHPFNLIVRVPLTGIPHIDERWTGTPVMIIPDNTGPVGTQPLSEPVELDVTWTGSTFIVVTCSFHCTDRVTLALLDPNRQWCDLEFELFHISLEQPVDYRPMELDSDPMPMYDMADIY